jgi:type VI secretion system secreted protein VgrG
MEASGKISIDGVNIIVTGKTDIKESAPTVEISGTQKTVMGVGTQTVTCDTAKVATSGAGISATAVGVHEISGAMVKIN